MLAHSSGVWSKLPRGLLWLKLDMLLKEINNHVHDHLFEIPFLLLLPLNFLDEKVVLLPQLRILSAERLKHLF